MKKWIWIVLGGLVVAGSGFTVWDYRQWRKAETENYGHGYNETLEPAMKLSRVYQNTQMRIRMKYPESWEVKELIPTKTQEKLTVEQILTGGTRKKIATWENMSVEMELSKLSSGDFADREVEKLGKEGITLLYERSYIRQEDWDMVIMTWKQGEEIYQRALTVKDGLAFVITVMAKNGEEWNKLERTFDEIYRSLVTL